MKPKRTILLFLCALAGLLASGPAHAAAARPTTRDLIGRWNGVIEFGKFKFRMNLKVAPAEEPGRVKVTMDNPDRGMKDMPISALLYNHPDVRLEIDQFGTAFNGRINPAGTEIEGEFEEGPGGRAVAVTFKKNTEPDQPEPVKSYTFAPGETPDMRGYWKGTIEPMPGMTLRIGLKIGRLPDGTFHALMDSFDQGAADLAATSVKLTNGVTNIEWEPLRLIYQPKLSEDGKKLSGPWKQGPKEMTVTFDRLDKPATALPADISLVPDKSDPADIRGPWKGTLEVDEEKLRLEFKIGRTPDGAHHATLASIDQGGRDMLASSVGYTNPVVRIEAKGIRGTYTGTLNKAGTEFDGTWEQFGRPTPLKLVRGSHAAAARR